MLNKRTNKWTCCRFLPSSCQAATCQNVPPSTIGPFTLAKIKIQKTWVFCCTVYTARKTHNIQGFWHEKRMREKPESHTCVLVSGAHARLLSTFDRTRVVRITSRAAVGWFRWRSRTTWPKPEYRRDWSERLHWQKTSEISAEFQKIMLRRWVFGVFRGSCLATFNEKPECEKDSGFLMPV